MRRALPLLLTLSLFALAQSPAFADRDDDDHQGVKHDCGGPGCHGYVDLRINAFIPQGPDAPANLVVYVGRTPQAPVDGVYRVPLTDAQGRWIEDDVELSPLKRAPFTPGSYVVIRLGEGRYVQGVFGFMRRGNIYVAATATTAGPRVLSVKSLKAARFERQGDHRFVPNDPNQDEFEVAGQVTTLHATASTHADLLLTRVTCRGANLCVDVTCAPSDQCHDAGVCDPATGHCSNPPKANDAPCDDGDACTQTDTCQSGLCVGANPKTCTTQDQCHGAGACDPATGSCSSPQLPDGTPCNDGQFCTKTAWCQQGACVRQAAIVCDAAAECHEAGVCDDALRECVYNTKGDGAPCSDGNACTLGDYCVGGLCLGNTGVVSCPGATQCLSGSTCDPTSGNCNAQQPVNEGGACNDGVNCTTNDTCQQGTCAGTPIVCGPATPCAAAGVCIEPVGQCYYAPAVAGTVCRPSKGFCDLPESCDGVSPTCPPDAKSTAVCRAAAGLCDLAESCDGVTDDCPADRKSTAVCRAAAGACDVAESCDGVSNDCPADQKSTAVCRAAAGVCDLAESCDGITNDCPPDQKSTAVCRAAAGVCDVAESCDGVTNDCPTDLKSSEICRPAAGICDVTESCDGVGNDCPPNAFKGPGIECRALAGPCDVAETCTGASADCPADAKSTAVCRPSAGVCDVAESCDGTNDACPPDGYAPSTTQCRASVNACDPAETCTGASATCPADVTNNGTPACQPCTGYTCLRNVPSMIVFGGGRPGTRLNDLWALMLPPGDTPTWIQINAAGTPPSPRSATAVYDSARDRVLIYGGHNDASQVFSEVWALSLTGTPTWTQLSPSGNAPSKTWAGAFYQAGSDRLLVSMGTNLAQCSNTTDALALAPPNWSVVSPSGTAPQGRYSNLGFAYDDATQRLFVHGGSQQFPASCLPCTSGCSSLNDTYVLDASGATPNWSALAAAGLPTVAAYSSLIWDPLGRRLVRFGGSTAGSTGTYLDETWGMSDPATGSAAWTQYSPSQRPSGRMGAITAYDPGNRRMLIYGGLASPTTLTTDPDLWALDLSSATSLRGWNRLTTHGAPPSLRFEAAVVYVPAKPCAVPCTGGQVCRGGQCVTPDSWSATSMTNAPPVLATFDAVPSNSVWTGTQLVVYGGTGAGGLPSSAGAAYDPAHDQWSTLSTTNAPGTKVSHNVVWTGKRVIVWGGSSPSSNTGALYDPSTDTWAPMSTTNAPQARAAAAAVWTGSKMIVWGGVNGLTRLNTGGAYDPEADTWTAISATNAPTAANAPLSVWTGTHMLVWGGNSYSGCGLQSGGRYDPGTDTWSPISTTNAPPALVGGRAVWTGSEMFVFGGNTCAAGASNAGGRYNPVTNTWAAVSTTNAPSARTMFSMVWTGTRALLWGGTGNNPPASSVYRDGFLYDPAANAWSSISTTGAPAARYYIPGAVWTGAQLVLWGGYDGSTQLNTGGVYTPP